MVVVKCTDGVQPFEAYCSPPATKNVTWLGLEAQSLSSFLILGAAGVLMCALLCMCVFALRKWRLGKKSGEVESKWFLNVLKDQVAEIQKAGPTKEKDISSTPLCPPSPATETPTPPPIESISEPTPTPENLEDTFEGHLQYDEPVQLHLKLEYPAVFEHQLQPPTGAN
jgi:hypothetical protein